MSELLFDHFVEQNTHQLFNLFLEHYWIDVASKHLEKVWGLQGILQYLGGSKHPNLRKVRHCVASRSVRKEGSFSQCMVRTTYQPPF